MTIEAPARGGRVINVAALYIDPRGPYPKIPGVDCWDESRDARLYDGPHPVVAHPPCRNWSRLRHLAKGDDSDCAIRAVEQVRAFGGVLEHPAGSKLWGDDDADGEGGLLPPPGCRDVQGGYTIDVEQVEWGHACRKRTWLYLVGVPRSAIEPPPFPGRAPTHCVSWDAERARRNGYALKRASSAAGRRTPPLFAEYLVRLARAAGEAQRAA